MAATRAEFLLLDLIINATCRCHDGVLASMVGGWLATGRNDSGGPAAVRACNFGGMFLWSVSHLPSCLHFSVELAGMVICNK